MAQLGGGVQSTEHPRGRYADWKDGWYKVNGRYVKIKNGRAVKVQDNPPAAGTTTTSGNGGGGGGSYGGGGGGGGGSSTKPYMNYYTRILNIKPNMALVKKAAAGNYTMQEFQLLVQREDTNRFLKTWQGQQVAEQFRTLWARIFPSLGRQPGIRALNLFLKQKPSKDYRTITNPTSIRGMYAFLSKTKLFKKIYPEFAHTQFARTLNFAGYRQYKDQFRNVYRQYTRGLASDKDISYFFRSRIAPQEFEQNLKTMMLGGEAYRYATGAPVEDETQRRAIYGRRGSAQTLAKVAAAYQAREDFMKSKTIDVALEREQATNRIVQRRAY